MIVRRLLAAVILLVAGLQAAVAQNLTLTNLRYDAGFMTISIPRMEVSGTSLSETEVRGILDGTGPGDPVARLARLQASTITIPELVMVQDIGSGGKQTLTYYDIAVSDVVAGVIGRTRSRGMVGEMTDPAIGKMPFTIGEMTAEGVDLPASARALVSAVPDPSKEPMATLYKSMSYRDYVIKMPGSMGEIRIANLVGRDGKARPGKEPLLTTFRSLMEMSEKQKAAGKSGDEPSASEFALIAKMLAFFENFEYGVIDVEGISGSVISSKDTGSLSIARMRYSDQAQQAGFAMSDMRLQAGPAKVALAEFEMRDFSFASSFKALAEFMERGDMAGLASGYARLIPTLGTIRLKGFNVEAPDTSTGTTPGNRRGTPEIIRASVKSMELGFGQQIDGVPTAIRFSAEELAAPLSPTSRDTGVRDLIAMGFKDVNLSWLADLAWQKDRNQLDIKALNLSGKDMASLAIAGQLGNVTRDAFALDTAVAQIAWLSATANRLTMTFENFGGAEKVIAREAAKARKTPEALRREWGSLAAIALPAMLGDSDGAKALTNAVSRFIARPNKLGIDITARSPNGIGLADAVQAMSAPQALFDKIEVKARAD